MQKKQQQLKNKVSDKKIISAEAEISEDIADLYDIKATYVYEGQTIVEDLEDLNEYNTIEKLEVIKLKKYGLVKDFGKLFFQQIKEFHFRSPPFQILLQDLVHYSELSGRREYL